MEINWIKTTNVHIVRKLLHERSILKDTSVFTRTSLYIDVKFLAVIKLTPEKKDSTNI